MNKQMTYPFKLWGVYWEFNHIDAPPHLESLWSTEEAANKAAAKLTGYDSVTVLELYVNHEWLVHSPEVIKQWDREYEQEKRNRSRS